MKQKKPNYDTFNLKNEFDSHEQFINYVKNLSLKVIKTNKKIEYLNVPSVVDIETSSFINNNGEKTAIMYCFTIGINGHSYFGRTYDELFEMLQLFTDTFNLSFEKRLIVYVHNLAYEFQFFYKRFSWNRIFAIKDRTPLTALTTGGIEFRCSFLLSGYSLEKTGEHLQKYKVEKKIGDLDYSLLRHSKTPMTKEEIGYVLNDGLVVMAYIQEYIEQVGNITRIPLTKTGSVRKYCRDECLYGGGGKHKHSVSNYRNYRAIMNQTTIASVNEYKQLKRAFSGGFTHANGLCVGTNVNDVTSFDFTSSYPYVMISEKFPMMKGELIEHLTREIFDLSIQKYCCLFDVTFVGLKSIIFYEHYISSSHCINLKNFRLDNGRIIDADELTITITEQDYFIIKKCYSWEKMKVKNFRRYKRNYLPTAFVNSILKLYKDKTELKGVDGKEIEYLNSKELINSCYGMAVTDICREETIFNVDNNIWDADKPPIDYEKDLEKYNNSKQRFLSYAWGVWVTAYARRNLWNGIFEFKEHYLYSDTDSLKVIHEQEHTKYIESYNEKVMLKLKRAMDYHRLPIEICSPKSIDGKVHTIGLWDREYHLQVFKTLGAKRYMVRFDNGKESLTISGVNKKIAIPYLQSKGDIFSQFKEDMYIPKGYTGKKIHTYIDEERIGVVSDYLGNVEEYHEYSCVHLEESDYTLSLARDYVEFLLSIKMLEFN